ncbi:MAG TPA: glycogen synthase GlgA [Acidimicrobiia bacterium]|nr:glycogen synthase GlgA [Acidimicrobiia bacterium]
MKILFVASEVAPFAKTGGLADVAASLPRALAALGHDVRLVMPLYDRVLDNGHQPRPAGQITFELGGRQITAGVGRLDLESVPVALVDVPDLYHRGDLYGDESDEGLRFAVLSVAALELCRLGDWSPDIIHCNDWQTGLIPLYLGTRYAGERRFAATSTVLTIHNLAYQGKFPSRTLGDLGLLGHRHLFHQEHLTQGWLGFLETGLIHADMLTTVSPTYATEILTPAYGAGLDGLLRRRADHLVGILNGIDETVWNPAVDQHIPHQYSQKTLWRKEWNKRQLLESLGMPYEEHAPLFGVVSRLVSQKGIGLLPWPISGVLESTNSRFVALGSGEPDIEGRLRWLTDRFPGRAHFVSGYDEPLAHQIEAGADVFLMPSQYEPSGLNQMYSLAYGTPPLVRKTGGLADTVHHWQPAAGTGTGFVFENFDEGGVWWALNQALEAMRDSTGWKRLQWNGMAVDNSWGARAREYEALYMEIGGER